MFTPVETAVGAVLLHIATTTLLFDAGAILGISGLLRQLLNSPRRTWQEQRYAIWIFAGMTLATTLVANFLPDLVPMYESFDWRTTGILKATCAGILTGWGTKHCGGCTSGHMLCGIGRLSPRSLLATAIFFPTAVATFHITNPALKTADCPSGTRCYRPTYPGFGAMVPLVVLLVPIGAGLAFVRAQGASAATLGSTYGASGLIFGLGLLVSGMANPAKVQGFFALSPLSLDKWDPSLILVIIFAVLPNMLAVQTRGLSRPPKLALRFSLPTKTMQDVDFRFILGAVAFGAAWGWSGVCPGPAVMRTYLQPSWGLFWMLGFSIGGLEL